MNTLLLLTVLSATPAVVRPADSPMTVERASLGRQLFFDPRLSSTRQVSCSTCHQPEKGWTNGLRVGVGVLNRSGERNVPTIINTAFQRLQFWDGRAEHLEGQALAPLQNPREMGPQTLDDVMARVNSIPGYRAQFNRVFGRDATSEDVARAFASFERSVISKDAPIDRFLDGKTWALNGQQKRGYRLFVSSRCNECHQPGKDFRDHAFHNVGSSVGEIEQGRFTISQQAEDFKAFKTPTLREVGKTAPYMHNGRLRNLEEVVEFFDRGGDGDQNQDARIRPLGLSSQDKADLVFFLQTAFAGSKYPMVKAPKLP